MTRQWLTPAEEVTATELGDIQIGEDFFNEALNDPRP